MNNRKKNFIGVQLSFLELELEWALVFQASSFKIRRELNVYLHKKLVKPICSVRASFGLCSGRAHSRFIHFKYHTVESERLKLNLGPDGFE